MEILPAIMPESLDDLREKLSRVSKLVPWVQIDVMDGILVRSKSWPYKSRNDADFLKILSGQEGMPLWQEFNFELDLMVSQPEVETSRWISAGAGRIILHFESFKNDPRPILEEIKNKDTEVGLAIDMKTPIENILPFLDQVNLVQLMGIDYDGFQGVPFDEKVIEKIKELKEKSPSTLISVDGGINLDTAPAVIEAGADRLVVGSAIFTSVDIKKSIRDFQAL